MGAPMRYNLFFNLSNLLSQNKPEIWTTNFWRTLHLLLEDRAVSNPKAFAHHSSVHFPFRIWGNILTGKSAESEIADTDHSVLWDNKRQGYSNIINLQVVLDIRKRTSPVRNKCGWIVKTGGVNEFLSHPPLLCCMSLATSFRPINRRLLCLRWQTGSTNPASIASLLIGFTGYEHMHLVGIILSYNKIMAARLSKIKRLWPLE